MRLDSSKYYEFAEMSLKKLDSIEIKAKGNFKKITSKLVIKKNI